MFGVLQCMRKHDVLLRDQSDSDAVTDGGVEEITDLFRGHVLCAFLKPAKSERKIVYCLVNRIGARARVVWKEEGQLTHPLAMVGRSFAWSRTRASSCAVNIAFSSRFFTCGYVAFHKKLFLNPSRIRAMYGFVPTINGRDSRDRIRVASRRGISACAYETEVSTDSGVKGCPVSRRVPTVRGRGVCCA
jgi:hypothetical protein